MKNLSGMFRKFRRFTPLRQVDSRCFMLISGIQGKAISARELTDMETTVPCYSFPAGKYIITLKSEVGLLNESFKMIKAE